jgi:hypothetical protein
MAGNKEPEDDETKPTGTLTGVQGKSGASASQGVQDTGRAGPAVDVHPNQITDWNKQLQERVADVFDAGKASSVAPPIDVKVLHAKIGQLTLKNDS